MRINCQHGYFKFIEDTPGEVFRFMNLFDLTLVPKDDYFTFDSLEDAPDYSVLGTEYLTLVSTKTFEGEPAEVMRANGIVYNFALDIFQPILSVITLASIKQASGYFISNGLILPGSLKDDGARVTDYLAWFSFDSQKFKYPSITYE